MMVVSGCWRLGLAAVVLVCGVGVGPARAAVEQVQYRQPYGDQQGGYGDQRGGYNDQRGDSNDQRRGYDDQRGGYNDQRGGYNDQRREQSDDRRQSSAPGGTYRQSCGRVQVQGSTLTAVCRNGRGESFESSIDLGRCGRSDIGNSDGALDCNGVRGRARRVQ